MEETQIISLAPIGDNFYNENEIYTLAPEGGQFYNESDDDDKMNNINENENEKENNEYREDSDGCQLDSDGDPKYIDEANDKIKILKKKIGKKTDDILQIERRIKALEEICGAERITTQKNLFLCNKLNLKQRFDSLNSIQQNHVVFFGQIFRTWDNIKYWGQMSGIIIAGLGLGLLQNYITKNIFK